MAVVLRQAICIDQRLVAYLEEVCMRDYAVALWGHWRPRPPEDFVADRHRIIVSDDTDIGCVETVRHDDHLWLGKLYLLPSHQRKGLGAEVLHEMILEAKGFGLPLRLSVLTTNPAQAFYRREGLIARSNDQERIIFETGPPVHCVAN